MGFGGGLAVHSYVDNPNDWIDPLGLAAEDYQRMRHYTNSKGKKAIASEGMLRAQDQNKVFMVPAKGRPKSPTDASNDLGIKPGRGKHVLEFNVRKDRVYPRHNAKCTFEEWVADGDLKIYDIKVIR